MAVPAALRQERPIERAFEASYLPLAVLAYLYPPGATADARWWVRWEAAKVIRRAVRAAS